MHYPLLSDEYFMNEALKEAKNAYARDEVPVGCVITVNNRLIARTHNMTEELQDVTAHAEILAITAASHQLGSKYLQDCTLYVSLEPCPMCAAAMKWAQLGKLVFAASDPREGYSQISPGLLHPKTIVQAGILELESELLLKEFFRQKRR